jgi:hypothetical protein
MGANGWKVAAAIIGVGIANPASAFTLLDDLSAGWSEQELTFLVNESSCTALGISAAQLNAAIDAAVDAWNAVPTSNLKLVKGGKTTDTGATNPPVLYCSTSLGDSIAGVGSAGISGGRPIIGALELNGDSAKAAYFGKLSEAKQKVTVTREMGHVLGMGHSDQDFALMYYSIGAKADLRLAQDDMDALSWLYPRNEFSDGVLGCASTQEGGNGGPEEGGNGPFTAVILFLLFVMAWLAAKRGSPSRALG